jgi:hypothetical protein
MMNANHKTRRASHFYPVLLSEVATPLNLDKESQLYVQTAFISLSEHNYEDALNHLREARDIQRISRIENELFFHFIEGQIFEAMGRDDIALDKYYKCKCKRYLI